MEHDYPMECPAIKPIHFVTFPMATTLYLKEVLSRTLASAPGLNNSKLPYQEGCERQHRMKLVSTTNKDVGSLIVS